MDRRTAMTDRLRKQIVEMHLANVTGREIARQLHLPNGSVSRVIVGWHKANPNHENELGQESITDYVNVVRKYNDIEREM